MSYTLQMPNSNKFWILIFAIFNVILFYILYKFNFRLSSIKEIYIFKSVSQPRDSFIEALDYFDRETEWCEKMGNWTSYKMSDDYNRLVDTLNKEQIKLNTPSGEGFSASLSSERIILHHLARQSFVRTICETGFNYGHSSFNFLSANPTAQVYSFDLGSHGYVKPMNATVNRLFPDHRHHLTIGDSRKTVPKAIKYGFLPKCDFIFVDGGHVYPVAKSDIVHFSNHASDNNIIMFDDYPTNWGMGFGKAWEESLTGKKLKKGETINYEKIKEFVEKKPRATEDFSKLAGNFVIKELLRCRILKKNILQRGFVVGVVIKI